MKNSKKQSIKARQGILGMMLQPLVMMSMQARIVSLTADITGIRHH